jgi:hypothetical protein
MVNQGSQSVCVEQGATLLQIFSVWLLPFS